MLHSYLQVEFPEARIYEETLNILLYESRTEPDQELMKATSTRGAVAGVSSYTSDEEEERSGLARLRSNKQNNTSLNQWCMVWLGLISRRFWTTPWSGDSQSFNVYRTYFGMFFFYYVLRNLLFFIRLSWIQPQSQTRCATRKTKHNNATAWKKS